MGKACSVSQCDDLCSKLAILALNGGNVEVLKMILDTHGEKDIHWPFYHSFDLLKHDGGDPDLIRVVEESKFESMVPPGKRFSDLHPLDYM